MRLLKKCKNYCVDVLRSGKSPHSIALGFAIGTFIGIFPTPGFGTLAGVAIVLLFKKVNQYSLFGSMALWNFITLPPIYYLSYKLGDVILHSQPQVEIELTLLDQVYHYSRRFLVGSTIIASVASALSYFIVRPIAARMRKI